MDSVENDEFFFPNEVDPTFFNKELSRTTLDVQVEWLLSDRVIIPCFKFFPPQLFSQAESNRSA